MKKSAPKKPAGKPAPRAAKAKTTKPAKLITAVHDVYYNVEDMNRAVKFYGEVLGLSVVDTSEWWTSLDVGGLRVGLHGMGGGKVHHVPRDDHGSHGGATLTLRVSDIRAAVSELGAKGVKFLGEISDDPWGSLVAFEDSEGNVLKLMQPPGAHRNKGV